MRERIIMAVMEVMGVIRVVKVMEDCDGKV